MTLKDGMIEIVYGSYKDGSDIYKDSNGYYIFQYNPKLNKEYKKYISKAYKPEGEPIVRKLKCTRKNKNGKWKGCVWTFPKGLKLTKKNKSRKSRT